MRRVTLGALLALSGCYPQCFGRCSAPTRCGQFLDSWIQDRGPGGPWVTIEEVQALEDEILSKVSSLGDPYLTDPQVQCRRLTGLRVYPHSEASWVDEWGRRVYGLAYCDTGTIMMGSGQTLRATSYTHEVIHWLQACRTSVDHGARLVDGEGYHANWGADGIWALIDSVKRGQ